MDKIKSAKFRESVYLDLKDAYGDKIDYSLEDFNKQLDSNTDFIKSVHRDMKNAYSDWGFSGAPDDFASLLYRGERLKKKDSGILPPTELFSQTNEPKSSQPSTSTPVSEKTSTPTKPKAETKYAPVETKDTVIDVERETQFTPVDQPEMEASLKVVKEDRAAVEEKKRLDAIKQYHNQNIVEAEQRGFNNTDQLFEDRKTFIAQQFLTEDIDKQEFELAEQLSQARKNYSRVLGTQTEAEKTALGALTRAELNYRDFIANRDAKIDEQIGTLTGLKMAAEASGAPLVGDVIDFDSRIQTLQNKKGRFFKEKQEKQVYQENQQEIEKLDIGGKTPQEKLKRYYNALYSEWQNLQTKYPNITKPTGIAGSLVGNFVATDDTPDQARQRYAELSNKLESIAPIVLVNRNPLEQDTPLSTFGKAAIRSLDPIAQAKVGTEQGTSQAIGEVISDISIPPNALEANVSESLKKTAQRYEDYTANDWATMLGTTAGAIAPTTVGSIVVNLAGGALLKTAKGFTKGTKVGEAIAKNEEALKAFANTKTGKILQPFYEGVKTGTTYEVGSQFFGTPDSELDFMSGFFGGVAGKGIEGALKAAKPVALKQLTNLFGIQAPAAINMISKYGNTIKNIQNAGEVGLKMGAQGIGEAAEEFGEMFGQFYQETDSFKQAWDLFTQEFGEDGTAAKTFVSSFILGAGFGAGTSLGDLFTRNAKNIYDNATPEQALKYDGFIKRMALDVNSVAEKEGIKEEEPKGPEGPQGTTTPATTQTEQAAEAVEEKKEEVKPITPEAQAPEFAVEEEVEYINPATNTAEKGTISAINQDGTYTIKRPDGVEVQNIAAVEKVAAPAPTEQKAEEVVEEKTEVVVPIAPTEPVVQAEEAVAETTLTSAPEPQPTIAQVEEVAQTQETPAAPTEQKAEVIEPTKQPEVETIQPKAETQAKKTTALPTNKSTAAAEPSTVRPEWSKARSEGTYTKDTVTYTRQEPITQGDNRVVIGKEGQSIFKPGDTKAKAKFAYALTTLDSVQPTQKGVEINPNNFIPESQPKPLSEQRVQDNKARAANFENEAIGVSGADPFKGFVNTNQRLEVFQGTGRWNILNENQDAQARIDYLKSVAETTGITPEQIDGFIANNPGKKIDIVRVYDVTDEQAIRLGQYGAAEAESTPVGTEENQIANRMTTQAQNQVYSIISNQLKAAPASTSQNILTTKGADILNALSKAKVLSATELERYKTPDGTISEEGVRLIKSVYANIAANPDTQNNLLAKLPSNVQQAITESSIFIAGTPQKDSIVTDFKKSVQGYYKFVNETKKTGTDINQWLNQKDTLTGRVNLDLYTPFQIALMKNLYDSQTKPTVLQQSLRSYNQALNGKADLFGDVPPMTREEAVRYVWGVDHTEDNTQEKKSLGTIQEMEAASKAADSMLDDVDSLFNEQTQTTNTDETQDTQEIEPNPAIIDETNEQEANLAYGSPEQAISALTDAAIQAKQAAQSLAPYAASNLLRWNRREYTDFAGELARQGNLVIRGAQADTPQQIAELTSIIRNPKIENLAIVFIKDGKAVKMPVGTSGIVDGINYNSFPDVDYAIQNGIDQIYLVHNHPSGNPTPSDVDIDSIKNLKNYAQGKVKIGGLVLNGDTFYDIETLKAIPYSTAKPKFFTPGSKADTVTEVGDLMASVMKANNTSGLAVFVDARLSIIEALHIPTQLKEVGYAKWVNEQSEILGASKVLVGMTEQQFTNTYPNAKVYYPRLQEYIVILNDQGQAQIFNNKEFRTAVGLSSVPPQVVGVPPIGKYNDTTLFSEDVSQILDNPKFFEFANKFVSEAYMGGRFGIDSILSKLYEKNDSRLEALVPYIIQAYKDYKTFVTNSPDYTAEAKNQFSSNEEIDNIDTNEIKQQVERKLEQQRIEQDAAARRQADLNELGLESKPIYDGGVRYGDGSYGRPPLRYSAPAASSPYANVNPRVAQIVVGEQYPILDQHQIYGVNMALTRFKEGQPAFLLADGTGVGKTMQELIIAVELAKQTNKPVIIVTINDQVIEDNFKADAVKAKVSREIMPSPTAGKVSFYTYTDLSLGKIKDLDYGAIIFDEAHNLKNISSKKSINADALKAQHVVYATATPMDKVTNSHYFLSKITGYSPEAIQQALGYTVIVSVDADGNSSTSVQFVDGTTKQDAVKNIIAMRNEALSKGLMIRRNYPFYGQVEEISKLPVDAEFLDKQARIEQYFDKRINAVSRYEKDPVIKSQKILAIAGDKAGELARLTEPYKVNYTAIRALNEVKAGRKVVIVIQGVNDTVLKGLDKEKVPSIYNTLLKKLQDKGLKVGSILGADKKSKQAAANQFQEGMLDAVIMTPQSGGTGINLDDTKGDAPRTILYVTPDYAGDTLQQVLGRVSRRNTKSASRSVLIYTDSLSDQKRKRIVADKMAVLQAIQDGLDPDEIMAEQGVSEDQKPSLFDSANNNLNTTHAKSTTEPYVVPQPSGYQFVYNSYHIKEVLKSMGAIFRKDKDGVPVWILPETKTQELQAFIDAYYRLSDSGRSLKDRISQAHADYLAALNEDRKYMGANRFPFKSFMAAARLAGLYIQKGITDFAKLLKSLPSTLSKTAKDILQNAFNASLFKSKVPPLDISKLTIPERNQLADSINTAYNTATDYTSLMNNLQALDTTMSRFARMANMRGVLQDFMNKLGTVNTLDAAKTLRYNSIPTRNEVAAQSFMDNIRYNPKNNILKEKWLKFTESMTLISAGLDSPYIAVNRLLVDKIQKEYGIPKEFAVPMHRRFEQIAGYLGKAKNTANKIDKMLAGVKMPNGTQSKKLNTKEIEIFENMLIALRTIDRLKNDKATGNLSIGLMENVLKGIENNIGKERYDELMHRADMFQTIMQDNLDALLEGGIISQDSYDAVVKGRDFYAPFAVVHEGFDQNFIQGANAKNTPYNPVRSITGIRTTLNYNFGGNYDAWLNEYRSGMLTIDGLYQKVFAQMDKDLNSGLITNEDYGNMLRILTDPGFQLLSVLDKAKQILFNSTMLIAKNKYMNDLGRVIEQDTQGLYAKMIAVNSYADIKGITPPKGFDVLFWKKAGDFKAAVVRQEVSQAINGFDKIRMGMMYDAVNLINNIFRTAVIGLSPSFIFANFAIYDLMRTAFFSRAGILAGFDTSIKAGAINLAMFVPDLVTTLFESFIYNTAGTKTKLSDKVTQGMQEFLDSAAFTGQSSFRDIFNTDSKTTVKVVNDFIKNILNIPTNSTEQAMKYFGYKRLMRGLKELKQDATDQEILDYIEQMNYEIANNVGSPNFTATSGKIKLFDIVFPFLAARVKGMMTDARRVKDILTLPIALATEAVTKKPAPSWMTRGGEGQGATTAASQSILFFQMAALMTTMMAVAAANFEDEEETIDFLNLPPQRQNSSMSIKTGNSFVYSMNDDTSIDLPEYLHISLRGFPEIMNALSVAFMKEVSINDKPTWNSVVKALRSEKVLDAIKDTSMPINTDGNDARERILSVISSTNPLIKFSVEYANNINTYTKKPIYPATMKKTIEEMENFKRLYRTDPEAFKAAGFDESMINELPKPYEMYSVNTPEWAIEYSKKLYELGIEIYPNSLDHMENTFLGNTVDRNFTQNPIKRALFRSGASYPLNYKFEQEYEERLRQIELEKQAETQRLTN